MRYRTPFRFLFILYCIEAGVVLIMTPWSRNWEAIVLASPWPTLSGFLLHGGVRGALTGFGIVHLLWATHDLLGWLNDRRRNETATAADPGDH